MSEIVPFPVNASLLQWRRGVLSLHPGPERDLLLKVLACMGDVIEGAENEGLLVELPEWGEIIAVAGCLPCGLCVSVSGPLLSAGAESCLRLISGAAEYCQMELDLPLR